MFFGVIKVAVLMDVHPHPQQGLCPVISLCFFNFLVVTHKRTSFCTDIHMFHVLPCPILLLGRVHTAHAHVHREGHNSSDKSLFRGRCDGRGLVVLLHICAGGSDQMLYQHITVLTPDITSRDLSKVGCMFSPKKSSSRRFFHRWTTGCGGIPVGLTCEKVSMYWWYIQNWWYKTKSIHVLVVHSKLVVQIFLVFLGGRFSNFFCFNRFPGNWKWVFRIQTFFFFCLKLCVFIAT